MAEPYISCDLDEIPVGETLPVTLYVYLDFRFITFRVEGLVMDRLTMDRLEFRRVKNLFIQEKDREKYRAWVAKRKAAEVEVVEKEDHGLHAAREESKRRLYDIFHSEHPDRLVVQTMDASKRIVEAVMKAEFAVSSLSLLQRYAKDSVDHSVNVSVLATYLAMQMGYSHSVILNHVGAGALLHDVGKPQVPIEDEDSPEVVESKMRAHPELGNQLIDSHRAVPNEVKMIVAQHYEYADGSGYPKKLRGAQIYDLARIVALANLFDELVIDGTGTLIERQRKAIQRLDQDLYKKFEAQKLEKALKILRLGV